MSSAINAAAGASATTSQTASASSMEGMTSDDFLKIMLAELTNQDPLEPMKNQDLLNQIASIRSMETESSMIKAIEDLRSSQQLGSAGSLIGKQVSGLTGPGDSANGTVDRVKMVEGEVILRLADGVEIPFEKVLEISGAEPSGNIDGGAV